MVLGISTSLVLSMSHLAMNTEGKEEGWRAQALGSLFLGDYWVCFLCDALISTRVAPGAVP